MTTIDTTRPDLDTPARTPSDQERADLLRRAVEGIRAARAEAAEARSATTAPIAVLGLGCRFPGGVVDADGFWALLTEGRSGITEVPADRWDVDAYYSADPDAPGRSYVRHGGFVDGVREFDAELFGIPPREAVSMDPQHRMVLEVAWEALEHAGLAPDQMRGTRTGVFVGMGGSDYERLNVAAGGVTDLGGYAATGGSGNMAANRVSYVLGLEGPSLVVDTACSSSLVAVHLASQALRLGECDTALVGGVNLLLSPESTVALAKGNMLSPTGRCHTFDGGADGYVRGEGCGVVVLRRLDAALRDSQDVLAVIRGSAVNQDGASSGLTVPRGPAQQDVITRALGMAGIAGADVDYVECHGTGTPLGDPIEIKALVAALGAGRPADRPLVVSSVKTNIGHLEAAAGIAGLIKSVLVVQHGTVPHHLNLVRPNPLVRWDELPVTIPTAPIELPAAERVAGTSSFGFGGTNAHVVLTGPPAPAPAAAAAANAAPFLVKIAGGDVAALRQNAARLAEHLRASTGPDLRAVAHAAGVGRADLAERAVVLAGSVPDLLAGLDAVAADDPAPPSTFRGRRGGRAPVVALVLPGSGDGLAGVLAGRYGTEQAITGTLDELAGVLGPVEGGPLRLLLDAGATALDPRPAVFALGVALGRWWESVGVRPDLVVGHGACAYAAAVVAGVMSAGDAARLVAAECAGQDPSGLLARTALAAAQAELVTDAPADVLRLGPASAEYWTARASRPRPAAEVEAAPEARRHTLVAGPTIAQVVGPAGLETAVARLWVAGGRLDWTRVNGPRPAAVPRLPCYAFQRRAHWTDAATAALTGEGRRQPRAPGWLPPTLLRTATGPTVAQTSVSLATVPFLDEHRVHGRIVVPGVVFLELVLRTAAEVLGGEAALTDLELQRPLVLADDETATLQVVLDPPVDGRAAVQVFSAAPDGEWNRHLRCSVAAGGPQVRTGAAEGDGPWPELTGDGQEFYRDAWHPDFRLGESFRVITRYGRRDGVAVGDIGEPPAHAAGLAAGIRPELLRLDAAVQLVGVARPGAGESGPVHLGTGYERLVVHGSLHHPTLRGTAVLRGGAAPAGQAVGDLVLRAPDGTVAAELLGVSFRPVTPEALDRVSSRAATATGVAELDRAAFAAADTAGREAVLAAHLAALLAAIRHSAVDDVARDVPLVDLADSLMLAELERTVQRTTGVRITLETLFQSTGVDDLARTLAPQISGPGTTPDEPATAPRRPPTRTRHKTVDEMLQLAELDPAIAVRGAPSATAPAATLLTGATGYVGAFLLDELLRRDGADVLCHVRAADEQQAMVRITSNLQRYGIDVGDAVRRIRPVLGDLAEPRLGLTDDEFTALHAQVGSMLHCGGMVKWTYPYRGLAPANVDGTREVLRLATLGDPRPVHFISTVGVFSSVEYEAESVGEDEPLENSGPLVVGYAQSKWVAERMVRTAAERGLPVTIHRINTGWHSTTGAFNRMDHLMMILKGCIEAGLAPDTMAMPVQPAPIDVVARGVVALSARAQAPGARTYHLVHDRPISWSTLFDLVEQHGYPMRRLPFDEWRTTITNRSSGTLALLGLAPFLEDTADDVRLPVSTTEETRRALGEAADCPPIDADLVGTVLRSFVTAGFVDPPAQ